MDVFIFPITVPKMISKDWLQELYPDCSLATIFEILEISVKNPKTILLGAFDTKTKELRGFVWGEGNPLDHSLFVNSIYVKKCYRKNPKVVGTMLDHIREHFQDWGFKKVFFMTKKPNFFLRRGCKQFEETCVILDIQSLDD